MLHTYKSCCTCNMTCTCATWLVHVQERACRNKCAPVWKIRWNRWSCKQTHCPHSGNRKSALRTPTISLSPGQIPLPKVYSHWLPKLASPACPLLLKGSACCERSCKRCCPGARGKVRAASQEGACDKSFEDRDLTAHFGANTSAWFFVSTRSTTMKTTRWI